MNPNSRLLLSLVGLQPFDFSFYSSSNNGQSLDIAPGARLRKDPLAKVPKAVIPIFSLLTFTHTAIDNNILKSSNFMPSVSSVAYTFPNGETPNVYKNFAGVTLNKCAGTTPFDAVYATQYDLNHVQIDADIANAFKDEVYNPKPKLNCPSPDCPDYLTLNTPSSSGTVTAKAGKAITLQTGFSAVGSQPTVFMSQIGCTNTSALPLSSLSGPPVKSAGCGAFTWDGSRNYCIKTGNNVRFGVFVKNMDISTFAEFSIDGATWHRATIGDNGWEVTVPWVSGGAQVFFARSADNRPASIIGSLSHCN